MLGATGRRAGAQAPSGTTFRRNRVRAPEVRVAAVSARFEARADPAGDDVAHEEVMAVGPFRGF